MQNFKENNVQKGTLFTEETPCKSCTTCAKCQPEIGNQLQLIENQLRKDYENFYQSPIRQELTQKIHHSDSLFATDPSSGILALVLIDEQPNLNYTSVNVKKMGTLSKKGLVSLSRGFDLFQSLTISCIDPIQDIDSVTLYVGIALPKDFRLMDLSTFNFEKYIKSDLYQKICFDSKLQNIHYFPIKTILKPQNNLIKFFDCPITLCSDTYMSYSIGVTMTPKWRAPIELSQICINYLMLNNGLRKYTMFKHNILEIPCPNQFKPLDQVMIDIQSLDQLGPSGQFII